ncbi:MAG: hypothetical protein ABIJ74_04565 [archaeon]
MITLPSHKDFVEKAPDLILIFGMLLGLILPIVGLILDIFTDLPVGAFKLGEMEVIGINTFTLTGVLLFSVSYYWHIKKREKGYKKEEITNKEHKLLIKTEGLCYLDSQGFLYINTLIKNLGEKDTTLEKVCLYLPNKNYEFEHQEIYKSLKAGMTLPRKEKFNVLHQNSEKCVELPSELEKNGIIRYYETFSTIDVKLKFKKNDKS